MTAAMDAARNMRRSMQCSSPPSPVGARRSIEGSLRFSMELLKACYTVSRSFHLSHGPHSRLRTCHAFARSPSLLALREMDIRRHGLSVYVYACLYHCPPM